LPWWSGTAARFQDQQRTRAALGVLPGGRTPAIARQHDDQAWIFSLKPQELEGKANQWATAWI
jgi:hypothetical protein